MNEQIDEAQIRYLVDVQSLALRPDDIIVISTDSQMSNDIANRIRDLVQARIPEHRCLVMSGGLRIGVLSPENTNTTTEREVKSAAHSAVQNAIRRSS